MANELLNALENRVNSAVDTIEGLRTELKELKAERLTLEDKMRDLLEKMGVVDDGTFPAPSSNPANADEIIEGSSSGALQDGSALGGSPSSSAMSTGIGTMSAPAETPPSGTTEAAPESRFGTGNYGFGSGGSEY